MTMEFFENASVVQEGVERQIYLPVAQVAAHTSQARQILNSKDDNHSITTRGTFLEGVNL